MVIGKIDLHRHLQPMKDEDILWSYKFNEAYCFSHAI